MYSLPIDNTEAIQINPNLGIILTGCMEGWFMERYVNIFMNGTIIDYVDNVNYSGAVVSVQIYTYDEIRSSGIIKIIEKEITENHYMHIWVDELYIPCSVRYNKCHFVHPLMIYGYDEDAQMLKAVFFNSAKGQQLVDIRYQDIVEATSSLDEFYQSGGTDGAIKEAAVSIFMPPYVKGIFHIDVFTKQLSNYICCCTEDCTEWYTTSRPGIYDSNDNIYGIQIYLQLIKLLQSKNIKDMEYKAIHDFISHKKQLLYRFKYIKEKYSTTIEFDKLIDTFENSYRLLERIRILNMKKQIQKGYLPSSLCRDSDYIDILVSALKQCYEIEMKILPKIYDELIKLTYPKLYHENNQIIHLSIDDGNVLYEYIEFDLSKFNTYVSQIDIIRRGERISGNGFEYIVINNEFQYYLEKDYPTHSPVRTVKFPALKIKMLKLFTDTKNCDYMINLYSMNNQYDSDSISVCLPEGWQVDHHVKRVDSSDKKGLTLQITDEDPYIIRESICIDADMYPYFGICMSTTAKTNCAQIYFTTVDSPYISMDKSLFFNVIPDGKSHFYYIDMRHNDKWHGLVQTMRLDPAQFYDEYPWENNREAICNIENIMFLKELPKK